MDPTHAKAVKQGASDAALSHLLSAQSQVEQARSRYQSLRALLPSMLMEAVRLTQDEQRAAVVGQQGRDAASGLIQHAEHALRQLTTALRGDHEAMAALTRQLDGEAARIHPTPSLPALPGDDGAQGDEAQRVAAALRGAIVAEVAQALEQQLQPLRAQVDALLAQLGTAAPAPPSTSR
ncbi:hypothetical protein KHF85_15365 [Xanthomonas translucens pv. graminis]|uniref:hypothetical protein n=1 Tax=Xanthomonas graminis TaxID=3390026 RepID=UPI0025415EF2|nr:hypothetical protein [Xanthomonas translucens]WIH04178.1 hypothetical protein KHF85_15365 [Xanthomonas translucens pv. graminis]